MQLCLSCCGSEVQLWILMIPRAVVDAWWPNGCRRGKGPQSHWALIHSPALFTHCPGHFQCFSAAYCEHAGIAGSVFFQPDGRCQYDLLWFLDAALSFGWALPLATGRGDGRAGDLEVTIRERASCTCGVLLLSLRSFSHIVDVRSAPSEDEHQRTDIRVSFNDKSSSTHSVKSCRVKGTKKVRLSENGEAWGGRVLKSTPPGLPAFLPVQLGSSFPMTLNRNKQVLKPDTNLLNQLACTLRGKLT